MDTQTLQIIADTFQKVSGDAVLGISVYLILEFLKAVIITAVPWMCSVWLVSKIVNFVGGFKVEKNDQGDVVTKKEKSEYAIQITTNIDKISLLTNLGRVIFISKDFMNNSEEQYITGNHVGKLGGKSWN